MPRRLHTSDSPAPPNARVVLLGASNLTRGISTVIETARLALGLEHGDQLDVLLAYGHGRSYGMRSTVLRRSLPGILECGLWDALRDKESAPTYALLTDIGNDVMYGVEPPLIADWIETCLDRLEPHRPRVSLTALPMPGIRGLRKWKYALVKGLIFPGCRMAYAEALDRAEQLDELVRRLAAQRGIAIVEPRADWYGFDPIHIRHRHWKTAWPVMLGPWHDELNIPRPRGSLARFIAIRRTLPQRWALMGRERLTPQPACRLADGTTVAMY